ncbi:Glutamate--tRNA ligase mitochondrial [Gnomoniopsis smithogilvyi]|uniref:Glutamate--tRNA ligase, mitochondrial n=1 Tax=Gnomoniopsis smithogilvyi TaxID=1191159 RepID=A0A9W9CYD4_9PEZI|nr:Glutamate--tRNA ligase mitochondrial [Gnomoniopsis smithogilvyi]
MRCLSSRLSQVRRYALIGKPKASIEPKWVLPKTPARTRFAPSPTGYLHLGSLRTALYNYLLAQATGGQFIIRLEDTDQARLVNDAEQVLYDDLRWAGLHWDEGPDKGGPFGPYKQSERLDLYTQHAKSLLESGHAFRCFCTKEDLEFNLQLATSSGGAAHYPGTCTHIEQGESDRRAANGEPHVVRFKSAEKPVPALDLVYGTYKKAEREDNFIIMKSDGFPTYHFANVVDDHFMKITHVIRGAEWLISTPKHVELYNAFGWQPPNFAHVGLLVDAQRQKLSKRDMANIGIGVYRTNKVIPEALLNFSALLGWDPNLQKNTHLNKRGVMTLEEMKQNFTLKFTRGDIIVDLSKLKFFQKQLTRSLITGENPDHATLRQQIIQPILAEVERVQTGLQEYQQDDAAAAAAATAEPHLRELYDSISPDGLGPALSEDYVLQVLKAWKGPVDDPFQFLQDNLFAFFRPSKDAMRKQYHELQRNKARIMILKPHRRTLYHADVSQVLKIFTSKLSDIKEDDWTAEKLGDIVKELTDSVKFYDTLENKDKFESAGWAFMRHGLINGKAGSAIVPLMLLFGQRETVRRIRDARKIAGEEEKILFSSAEEAGRARYGERKDHEIRQQKASGEEDRYDMEFHNVETEKSLEMEKFLTPSGEAPFKIYLQQEKGRGEPLTEGPFKSQPPTARPRSPPRDPSEVNRSPQFLSLSEFKFGTRHIKLSKAPKFRGPALDYVAGLQRQQGAPSQDIQAPERVQADALINAKEPGWVTPKPRNFKGQDAQSRSQEAGPPGVRVASKADTPIDIDSHGRAKDVKEENQNTAASGKEKKSSTDKKAGPFKPVGSELAIDRGSHVEYLRGLNRALALNRAELERRGLPGKEWKHPTRLQQLQGKGPGPMLQKSVLHDKSQTSAVGDTEHDSQHAHGGVQATTLASNHDRSTVRDEADRSDDK